MKKYIVVTAIATACLALCAAMWPQSDVTEEIPTPQVAAVSVPEPTVEGIEAEIETTPLTEGEKVEIPQAEPLRETIPDLEPVLEEIAESAEIQPKLKPEPEPTPVPTPVPVPQQTVMDPQLGDMVYVPSFGWLECQGPGEVIHDESIYENGNKIGIMG